MSSWKRGDSFFLDAPNSHLYFLVHAPVSEQVVVVNFITITEMIDTSCVIYPNEHPFITRESTIAISRTQLLPIDKLAISEQSGQIIRSSPVSKEITDRVFQALADSSMLKRRIKDFLRSLPHE